MTSLSVTSLSVTSFPVTSGSHATSGHAQWYILYYYGKKKGPEKLSLPVIFVEKKGGKPSLSVLWRHFLWCHFRLHPVAMLLPVMRSGIFCTTIEQKTREKLSLPCMLIIYFRDWHHFRSGPLPVTSLLVTHAQWPSLPLWSPRNMTWIVLIYYLDIFI